MNITQLSSSVATLCFRLVPQPIMRLWRRFIPAQALPQRKTRQRRPREHMGTLYYFDGVLDQLDGYFKSLRMLKRHDRETYNIYKRVGGIVTGRSALYDPHDLPATWRAGHRPTMAMIYLAAEHNKLAPDDKIGVEFVYFTKKAWRRDTQPLKPGEALYEITAFFADRESTRGRGFGIYHMAVSADGSYRLLKDLAHNVVRLPRGGSFTRNEWEMPVFLVSLSQEKENLGKRTPEDLANQLFCLLVNAAENCSLGIQVRASKGGLTATFNIDMLRTPYFFKDRSKTVTERGGTKKIFHIVRAHKRSNGKIVKTHFRGERSFVWHGYDVVVTLPGLHHLPLHELEATTHEIPESEPSPAGMIGCVGLGKRIARAMEKVA